VKTRKGEPYIKLANVDLELLGLIQRASSILGLKRYIRRTTPKRIKSVGREGA